ncbi:MAG: hypothetical protein AAF385_02500 [Pseudomonadota bacterium]
MNRHAWVWLLLGLLTLGKLNAAELDGRYDDVESLVYSLAPQLFGTSATGIRELAPVLSEQSEIRQDPFEPENWHASTQLKFAGLSLQFVEASDREGITVVQFSVSDLGHLAPFARARFQDTYSVTKLLGPPMTVAGDQWTYQGHHSSLQIDFEQGQVASISVWLHWC